MEDISFRVSKLEDMIKGNVKIYDLVKLENKMASKYYLEEMDLESISEEWLVKRISKG